MRKGDSSYAAPFETTQPGLTGRLTSVTSDSSLFFRFLILFSINLYFVFETLTSLNVFLKF